MNLKLLSVLAVMGFASPAFCWLFYQLGHLKGYHAALSRLQQMQNENAEFFKRMSEMLSVTKEDYKP